MSAQHTGWIPPQDRTPEQIELDELVQSTMPKFSLPVRDEGRYPLWRLAQKGLGGTLRYAHQMTGSCVGAAGYSATLTLMGVEIALGEAEEFQQIFWPWAYGQSRRLGGLRGRGEGSFGSAYFKAVRECGNLPMSAAARLNLPAFRMVNGWLQCDRETELRYSDGAAFAGADFTQLADDHLVTTGSRATTIQALLSLLQSGYPCTIASMFGTRTITPRGSGENRVNVAQWDDQWAHQMFIDEAWKHPELGWIFRIGNNWGPNVHPAPANDSPVGGFYVEERTMSRVLAARETEVFGLGGLSGFPVRQIDWYI